MLGLRSNSISSPGSDSIESLDNASTPGYIRPHIISSPLGVPSFISNKSFIDNEDAQLWLNTRHLLTKTDKENDELMIYCIKEISKSISNGLSNILNIIIDYYKYERHHLKEINNIIKIAKLSYDKNKSEIDINDESNFFNLLPTESISSICSFLQRNDIKSLKLVSADLGSICLHHMNQYRFGICNVNKLFLYPIYYKNIQNLTLDYKQIMNYDVHHSSKTTNELQKDIEKIYQIPYQYQLLSTTKKLLIQDIELNMRLMNHKPIRDISKTKRQFYVFDIRNIIKININNHHQSTIMNETDKTEYGISYKLQLLQYFDVYKQSLYTIQVLLINKNKTTPNMIIDYIQNHFIATTKQQQIWYKSVEHELKTSKLSLYQCYKDGNKNKNDGIHLLRTESKSSKRLIRNLTDSIPSFYDQSHNHESLIIQIDFSYKTNNNKCIEKLKNQYKLNEDLFCKDANLFNDKLNKSFKIKFKYLHNVSSLKSYLSYLKYDYCQDKVDRNINSILNKEYTENSMINYGKIRIEISKLFDNLISPKHIQLFRKYSGNDYWILDWNEKVENRVLNNNHLSQQIRNPIGIIPLHTHFSNESYISQQINDNDLNTIYFEFVSYDVRYLFSPDLELSKKTQKDNKSKKKRKRLSLSFLKKKRNSNKSDSNNICNVQNIKIDDDEKKSIYLNSDEYMYHIRIFSSYDHDIITPSMLNSNKYQNIIKYKSITMKYSMTFTINQAFIENIMKEIKRPIYGNNFNDILNLYFQNPDIDINGDILYALILDHKTYFLNDEYSHIRHHNKSAIHHLNLIIYPNPNKTLNQIDNNCIKNKIPILIRLYINGNTLNQYGNHGVHLYPVHALSPINTYINDMSDCYGIPLKLYINQGQTLQEIINNHTELRKLYIIKCYQFIKEKNNQQKEETILPLPSLQSPNLLSNNTTSSIITLPTMNNTLTSDDDDTNDINDINDIPRFAMQSTVNSPSASLYKPVKIINSMIYEPQYNDIIILEIRDNATITHTYLPSYHSKRATRFS